ncbi:uncharacterized protein G2W53_001972 [Senna tora]|uniref:Uncharacterized protein n=1 Tax=Senna tora TaxID=362788 RepID=A0A834XHA3_9FABA|nr:uncharacterized protein G2W53_001972 [Senna tora]
MVPWTIEPICCKYQVAEELPASAVVFCSSFRSTKAS